MIWFLTTRLVADKRKGATQHARRNGLPQPAIPTRQAAPGHGALLGAGGLQKRGNFSFAAPLRKNRKASLRPLQFLVNTPVVIYPPTITETTWTLAVYVNNPTKL
jgi:hypothetical protein